MPHIPVTFELDSELYAKLQALCRPGDTPEMILEQFLIGPIHDEWYRRKEAPAVAFDPPEPVDPAEYAAFIAALRALIDRSRAEGTRPEAIAEALTGAAYRVAHDIFSPRYRYAHQYAQHHISTTLDYFVDLHVREIEKDQE